MVKLTRCLVLFAVLGTLMIGCGDEPAPGIFQPSEDVSQGLAAKLGIPSGSTFESATLHIYLTDTYYRTITVQRITDPWDEMTVTWNNFGGAFAPDLFGSCSISGLGWRVADVSGLVEGWLNGTYSNYGVLLDQVQNWYPRNAFDSREATHVPYLEICYSTSSGIVCEQIQAIGDSYIDELHPDVNTGLSEVLFTGMSIGGCDEIYLSLIKFDEGPNGSPGLASIGDTVWNDENKNGIQDAGELGVPDVTVNLYDCSDVFVATMTTDANGYYLFSGLLPGGYYVKFILPEGYVFTLQGQGIDDAINSDADPVTGKTICTQLDAGEADMTWDAGIHLITFDGCTLTIGFWKTHAGFGPQDDVVTPLLPIWLGDAGGSNSILVSDAATAVDILKMDVYGTESNGITKLYAQLLGAKLNIANGANGASVGNTINNKADPFLADHYWTDWDTLSSSEQAKVLKWKDKLDDYNNGIVGPGHCNGSIL